MHFDLGNSLKRHLAKKLLRFCSFGQWINPFG